MNNVDSQYLDVLRDVYENGKTKHTRSGETLSVFGKTMRFNLQEGFPLLTTKKTFFKGIAHELIWFLSGETNIKYLVENNVHIWDDDAYRYYNELVNKHNEVTYLRDGKPIDPVSKEEFLEKVLKEERVEFDYHDRDNLFNSIKYCFGDLGPVYGKQWRNFGYNGVDQIQDIIDKLMTTPDDRRMLCVAFNPDMLPQMALPPCHIMFQFYSRELDTKERWELYYKKFKNEEFATNASEQEHITKYSASQEYYYKGEYDEELDNEGIPKRELSCFFYCRSQDLPLGTPYNIASYALLTHMIAHVTGMSVGELIYAGGDCHIYKNQLEGVKEQLSRDPHKYELPTLWINPEKRKLEDITYEDIKVQNYESYPTIKFPLSVG